MDGPNGESAQIKHRFTLFLSSNEPIIEKSRYLCADFQYESMIDISFRQSGGGVGTVVEVKNGDKIC